MEHAAILRRKTAPNLPVPKPVAAFVDLVMESWRADGGEPDIGTRLPAWLEELGFTIESTRPLVHIVQPTDELWHWPAAFVRVGLQRLVGLGQVTEARAQTLLAGIEACERRPGVRLATPGVLEIVARRAA
jgi:hypothetical protein